MRLTYFLLFLGAVSALPKQRRDIFSDFTSAIESAFGGGDDPETTTEASTRVVGAPVTATAASTQTSKGQTLAPPTTASATPSPTTSTETSIDSSSSTVSSKSSSDKSTITSSASIPSTTSTTSTSTSTSAAPVSTNAPPADQQPTSSNNGGGGISGGGIAVAIIMTLAILAVIAWIIFRYHPKVRAWWLARQEKKQQERSYRDALDGPLARGGARSEALGGGRKSMLASFFAPKTVRLGEGKEIRRKPVNWGAKPASTDAAGDRVGGGGMEKVALTDMAAPMARSESRKSNNSSLVSALTQKELPPMPPLPPQPPELAKRGDVHKILSRKSIFELA